MSDNQADDSQKTEQPTPHHKMEARKKGQIPQSREVQHLFVMGAFFGILWFLGPQIGQGFFQAFSQWLLTAGDTTRESTLLLSQIRTLMFKVFIGSGLIFAILMGAALLAVAMQTGLHVSTHPLSPKLERISLLSGFKRLFSLKGVTEFLKGFFKIALIGAVALSILRPEFERAETLIGVDVLGIAQEAKIVVCKILFSAVLVMVILALADYGFQFFSFLKDLRMTRQEIKDEQKNLEIDPLILRRYRERRRSIFESRRQVKAVEQATVVITNPIHYAIALKWEAAMNAPIVVAKGRGEWALKIREAAQKNFIPLVENPPLARVLYARLRVKQEILPEHYKAVAQIIRYVLDQKKR